MCFIMGSRDCLGELRACFTGHGSQELKRAGLYLTCVHSVLFWVFWYCFFLGGVPPVLLSYHWYTSLYEFQAYGTKVWLLCILWNDDHVKLRWHPPSPRDTWSHSLFIQMSSKLALGAEFNAAAEAKTNGQVPHPQRHRQPGLGISDYIYLNLSFHGFELCDHGQGLSPLGLSLRTTEEAYWHLPAKSLPRWLTEPGQVEYFRYRCKRHQLFSSAIVTASGPRILEGTPDVPTPLREGAGI